MSEETAAIEPPQTGADEAMNSLQRAFDKVAPDKLAKVVKASDAVRTPETTPSKEDKPPSKVTDAAQTPVVDKSKEEAKLPAFLEQSLGAKGEKPAPVEEEIPTEPPAEIKDEKAKSNWKRLRERKDAAEAALTDAQTKISELEKRGHEPDEATKLKLEGLETKNKQMSEALTRFGLETNEQFQAQVIQPLHASYSRARQIVGDAGGDVEALDKALSLSGKAQYEALDAVYSDIPDSAKRAADKSLDRFRELSQVRANALRNAPQTFEQIRKNELLRQKQTLDSQKAEFEKAFDDTVTDLSDVRKFELFQESKDPETAWWNQIKPKIVDDAKNDYLNAADPKVVAESAIARRSLPVVTELWKRALQRAVKAETELSEIRKSEPNLSESGGGTGAATEDAEDSKLSFEKLFLKTLKKQGAK